VNQVAVKDTDIQQAVVAETKLELQNCQSLSSTLAILLRFGHSMLKC